MGHGVKTFRRETRLSHAGVDPLHVRLQVPLAIALVAAVRTALRLVLAAGGLHVLDEMVLPSVRLGTLGTFVPILRLVGVSESDLATFVVVPRAAGRRAQHLAAVVVPNDVQLT